MLSYSKLNLLLGCFNQNVFSDAKMNIDLIRVFYGQDPYSKNNSLINKLLYIIDHYKFQDITEALFISTFQSDGKTDAEIADLVGKVKEYKTYNKDQSKVFRDDLKEICYQGYINRAKNKFPEDPVGFAEELKKFNYKTNVSNNLSVKLFNQLDITDLAQMYSGEGYKSSFKFINDSFTCGGYIPGQIVAVCAPPGCFHGDTEVCTLDGKSMKMRDLANMTDDDYKYVYSIDGSNYPVISKSSGCKLMGYVDHWTVLNIDDTIIKCTDDHEFMLIDGTYKMAKDLKPGDCLRSLERIHYSRFACGKYSIGDYEHVSTEGILPSYVPATHTMVYNYMISSMKFIPVEGVKYQVHHNSLINGKFDRSDNRPSKLIIMSERDHLSLHGKYQWSSDYDSKYEQLVNAGVGTRLTSDQISKRNFDNWRNPDYRSKMIETLRNNGKKLMEERNKALPNYNGASQQRVMATKKYVHYLIESNIIRSANDLTEEVFNSNRYGPRCPSWTSAMRYFSNDINRLYEESLSYQNHEIKAVSVEYCSSPEPCYDIVDVEFYENYCIKCGSNNSGVIVHNCGKSLFVQNEVVNFINQGRRVHILTLGDLNELDLATRLTCMMARKPKRVIESDIITYYDMYKNKFQDLLGLTVVPAGQVTAREYVDWMLDRIDDYDILIIDYDSNFKKDASMSMYDIYGDMYDTFTELVRHGKLIFVCTQPKIGYFRDEEIPLEALGESSRKQHIIDMAITIGKRFESKMRMGKMQIVKSRRGDLNQAQWIGTSEGLFYECSKILYARYRSQQDYIGLYTYDELQAMDVLGDVFSDEELSDIQ